MKKIILVAFLLITTISIGQKKKAVSKPPSFKITYDKFENVYNYSGEAGSFGIYASGTNNDFTGITYKYLTLSVYDSYLTHASGIILLFSDGTKMEIDTKEELGDNYGRGLWRYYVLTQLTEDQWLELSEKIIVSFKFHIFERDYKNGNQFKTLVNKFSTKM
jgi:hypothetical protein